MENLQSEIHRDYDKDPIIIKNIDEIFSGSVVVVALVIMYIYIMIDKNLSIIDLINAEGGFVSLIGFIFLCVIIYEMILSYKNGKTIYKISNDKISYISTEKNIVKNCNEITKINHILIRGHIYGYNQYQHRTFFQMLFKTDILELFFYICGYLYNIVFSILIYVPYYLIFTRFYKNLIIHFNNEHFLVLMFNNKKDYNEVIEYLKIKNLQIENKTQFIQMVQEEDIFKILKGVFNEKKWNQSFCGYDA